MKENGEKMREKEEEDERKRWLREKIKELSCHLLKAIYKKYFW
mgnify:CR=1 FL=1